MVLEHRREYQMCVCQQLEKASSNSSGKELCISFLDKLLRFYSSKHSPRATYRFTPETMKIVFHRLFFPSFLSVRES